MNENDDVLCVAVHSTTMSCRMNCSLHSTIRRFTTHTTLHLPQLSDLQTQTQRLISVTVKESCLHFAAARPTGVVFLRIGNVSSGWIADFRQHAGRHHSTGRAVRLAVHVAVSLLLSTRLAHAHQPTKS